MFVFSCKKKEKGGGGGGGGGGVGSQYRPDLKWNKWYAAIRTRFSQLFQLLLSPIDWLRRCCKFRQILSIKSPGYSFFSISACKLHAVVSFVAKAFGEMHANDSKICGWNRNTEHRNTLQFSYSKRTAIFLEDLSLLRVIETQQCSFLVKKLISWISL